jgi:hypothetical protein
VSVWRAYVDLILDKLLAEDYYADATDDEIVDTLVTGAPSYIRFTDFDRRRLVTEVAERRRASIPVPKADASPAGGPEGPIASPEQAVAAYREYGSDRKAARALGISRTHLRRLRGVDK